MTNLVCKFNPESRKPSHFLDGYLRSKSIVPSPDKYNIAKDLVIKQNPMHQKSPRKLYTDEIARFWKINQRPDMGTYQLNFKLTDRKLEGCFNFKSDRSGYLEEASLIGKEKPVLKNFVNYN